jgi:hypothetical protein
VCMGCIFWREARAAGNTSTRGKFKGAALCHAVLERKNEHQQVPQGHRHTAPPAAAEPHLSSSSKPRAEALSCLLRTPGTGTVKLPPASRHQVSPAGAGKSRHRDRWGRGQGK